MLWGVVTGMVHCGVVLRWADVQTDDAPRKVPEAFRGAVREGGGRRGEVRGRAKYTSDPSSHAAHQPHASQPTNQMEQSGEQPRNSQTIDRPKGRPFIVCHDKQQAASSKQRRAKPKSTSTSTFTSESRSRSKRVVAGNQSPRGGEGKWINRSEQVGVDDMTGIISMAKCGR